MSTINLIKNAFLDKYISYKIDKSSTLCCSQLTNNLDMIDFHQGFIENLTNEEEQELDDSFYAYGICIKHVQYVYDDKDIFLYKINNCPFCGEKIELNIVETKNVTKAYNEIEKKSNDLYYKANHTDSKKEEVELRKLAKIESDKLNSFYGSDSLKVLL